MTWDINSTMKGSLILRTEPETEQNSKTKTQQMMKCKPLNAIEVQISTLFIPHWSSSVEFKITG